MDKLHQRLERTISDGEYAAEQAEQARTELRRTTSPGQASREKRLKERIREINTVMEDVRSLVARAVWAEPPFPEKLESQLREVSRRLQYERRQLKKMLR